MRLPIRFRVRTLMGTVAFVALGFSVAFELKKHADRNQLLSFRAYCNREAAIHFKRALECLVAEANQQPYRRAERAKLSASDRVRTSTPPGGFRTWEAERLDHLFWGNRMYDQADSFDETLAAVEAKLLFPIPTRR
jgi:hypothetical protein